MQKNACRVANLSLFTLSPDESFLYFIFESCMSDALVSARAICPGKWRKKWKNHTEAEATDSRITMFKSRWHRVHIILIDTSVHFII